MTLFESGLENARNGLRISVDQALALHTEADLLTLGDLANRARFRMHPERVVTFVSDRNINYTNICRSGCRFCAFFRPPGDPEGYVIDSETLAAKIEETLSLGGTQILLQGGIHPDLDITYYETLLREMKQYPVHIHGFSPPEIDYIATVSDLSVETVIDRLMAAGLGSIPGGGAEILVDRVRGTLSPGKSSAAAWLDIMRIAHHKGLRSTATMMFGHIETPEEAILHMERIRTLQDETGGFTAFIPWTFQPDHTAISHVEKKTAADYLRMLALARLMLDNVPNLQASWVTQGDKIAQLALFFGANDFGSTMIEENVVAAAGVTFRLSADTIVRLIHAAGFRAVQRDCFYQPLKDFGEPAS